jgi:hypothetical protein
MIIPLAKLEGGVEMRYGGQVIACANGKDIQTASLVASTREHIVE